MKNFRYFYTVYDKNQKLVADRIGANEVVGIVEKSITTINDKSNSNKLLNGFFIRRGKQSLKNINPKWSCQNPKCPNRNVRHVGDHFGYIDKFMGEIKLCKSCKGVRFT